ncbi:antitoxin VbhA family protein [Paenibacillus tyrfis]|uniref:antitoxin VbhA family protein n=1 Tax=Paenibacillus tyrfis TaxID=1501230 RepID=UPI00209CA3CC|nr:antitoxin VbhA family protein [Paenibacillus tyrfis]MCP1312066.1 antitoxin VbhA family protein [Paenibacillus tyrfis]
MTKDEKIEDALRQALANLAIEGITVTAEGEELIRKKLRGEISQAEFVKASVELATRE